MPIRRLLGAFAAASAAMVLVAQARLVASGVLIARLGQQRGFSLAHVLVGSIISTIGVVAGIGLFLRLCIRPGPPPAETGARPSASTP